MTDNRTTELREKLTERGVKYQSIGKTLTYWNHDGSDNECDDADFVADERPDGTLTVEGLTPEQAIAATLGSGTLTAEHVEKAIRDCSTYASYDGCTYYASGIRLQAIADELNAELGSVPCEPKWTLQGETQTQEFWSCECGNCGECFGVETRESFPFKMTIDKVDIPNFCPNCGKAVKR